MGRKGPGPAGHREWLSAPVGHEAVCPHPLFGAKLPVRPRSYPERNPARDAGGEFAGGFPDFRSGVCRERARPGDRTPTEAGYPKRARGAGSPFRRPFRRYPCEGDLGRAPPFPPERADQGFGGLSFPRGAAGNLSQDNHPDADARDRGCGCPETGGIGPRTAMGVKRLPVRVPGSGGTGGPGWPPVGFLRENNAARSSEYPGRSIP